MKVFVAGATGAVGRPLVRRLVAAGHEVVGTTRSPNKIDVLRADGVEPVVLDALDRTAVIEAVAKAEPDVVVHELTALSTGIDPKHLDRSFALTNRLRTEGTDHLIAAAQEAGVRRFVAQSYGGSIYARTGGWVKSEDDPLDPDPASGGRETNRAIKYLEEAVLGSGLDAIALRYGSFYGPGTSIDRDGEHVQGVRRGRFPVVGDGTGVWSFIHVDDAAEATVAAIDRGRPGIYNIADDDPAPVSEWLPALASAAGAKRPRTVPVWLAGMVVGDFGVQLMTDNRGLANAKAKRELGWSPRHPSWREGFREVLGGGR